MRLRTWFFCWLIGPAMLVAGSLSAQNRLSAPVLPSDPKADLAIKTLYQQLLQIQANNKVLLGHQDALAYGVGWKQKPGQWRNDFESVSGEFPALLGFDLGELELGQSLNLDSVSFDLMRKAIQEGHKRGAVITLSWHGHNPLNGLHAWDTSDQTFPEILPGGKAHTKLTAYLDKLIAFIQTLQDEKGQAIPILFRPYHELTGNWFWWCSNSATPEQFKSLWKFTHWYFLDRGLHNLIWVYNVAWFKNANEVRAYFPGRTEADLISYDHYAFGSPENNARYIAEMQFKNRVMDTLSREWNLPWAIGETGLEKIGDDTWFTGTLAKAMQNPAPLYVLFWRNAGRQANGNMHYYVPYPGHPAAVDFASFVKLTYTWTLTDLKALRQSNTKSNK